IGDIGDAVGGKSGLQRPADAPDEADRLWGQEIQHLALADHREAAGFVKVGGNLGQELVVAEAYGDGDADALLDLKCQFRQRARRAARRQFLASARSRKTTG